MRDLLLIIAVIAAIAAAIFLLTGDAGEPRQREPSALERLSNETAGAAGRVTDRIGDATGRNRR
jgi:hypothetical protein